MSTTRPVKTAIAYITGEVRLDFAPPHGFTIEPKVEVDGVPSHLAPLEGGTATAWLFLGMVSAGSRHVTVTVGNVTATEEVHARKGTVTHLDFIFEKGD